MENDSKTKYKKPKILLVDMPKDTFEALQEKGLNVRKGTLGTPYEVEKTSNMRPVAYCGDLPNYTEQEIIILDFCIDETDFLKKPQSCNTRPPDEEQIWAKCSNGYIDPRPISSHKVQEGFNRILENGGVFIIFADEPIRMGFVSGYEYKERLKTYFSSKEIYIDIWDLLGILKDFKPKRKCGNEISLCEDSELKKYPFQSLQKLLMQHLDSAEYNCVFTQYYQKEWLQLCKNKFNECTGMIRISQNNGGLIFILPQIRDKTAFITEMLINVLPEMTPSLFPDFEKVKWIHFPEYELPQIIELQEKKQRLQAETDKRILELDTKIEEERLENGWLHHLLSGTNSQLVEAVKKALRFLGFENVIDVDEERDREGKSRREDLQIREDNYPVLILDVKGISGTPKDEDVEQANKHAVLRMREWKDSTVRGLSIMNYERHIPPLERNNNPFRREVLELAKELQFGLLTTWDLYRLVKNKTKNTWMPEYIKPLFYQHGRVEVLPCHYEFLGRITHVYPQKKAFGIDLHENSLVIGDRIAIQFPIEFEEFTIESMRVNDKPVDKADSGDPVGIQWTSDKVLKEGLFVFKINLSFERNANNGSSKI